MLLIHSKVKQRRLQLGMTQPQLAERVGISVPTLSRMERGLTEPGVLQALRVAEILDSGLRELWPSSSKIRSEQQEVLPGKISEQVHQENSPGEVLAPGTI